LKQKRFEQKGVIKMDSNELRSMSTDELWGLFEKVSSVLADKIEAEKAKLNERLRRIESVNTVGVNGVRRPYPPVRPKYRNPSNPAEVWSGRGKQPLWVRKQLKTGKKLGQMLIAANN
jgi:DNA-binding protein H-NS